MGLLLFCKPKKIPTWGFSTKLEPIIITPFHFGADITGTSSIQVHRKADALSTCFTVNDITTPHTDQLYDRNVNAGMEVLRISKQYDVDGTKCTANDLAA
jgi:hypothetical protein